MRILYIIDSIRIVEIKFILKEIQSRSERRRRSRLCAQFETQWRVRHVLRKRERIIL